MKDFKVGVVQLKATDDKDENIANMVDKVKRAAELGADVVALPEMWNCPYQNSYFPVFAEEEKGKSYLAMQKAAIDNDVYLVGGSIPIRKGDKVYNRAFVFNREGEEIHAYSKIHLFDIEGFSESDTITAGKSLGVFETEYGNFGLAICFDLRFNEMFEALKNLGAEAIFVPSTFSLRTGESAYHVLNRVRAIDNQVYIVTPAMARDEGLSRNAYAHSLVVEPNGKVILDMGEDPGIKIVELKQEVIDKEKKYMPLDRSRRERKM
ncbi:carbon-nitrogen hydrolase family protein [Peptoniphilus sp.]|jgi:omega-amidase|uniref:carbon-nitrogen hydrolase family protein n=1 Tax=Peptoniphilus sp. TaxID=1971214 RepID=UPI003D908400